jgi:hypothetical protein
MNRLIEAVASHFDEEGFTFTRLDDGDRLHMGWNSSNGSWHCLVSANEDEDVVFLHSVHPLKVPAGELGRVAEYLMRVNRIAFFGCFLMDFDTGEIRYETYVLTHSATGFDEALQAALAMNVRTMDKYIGGVARVISCELSPAEAIAEIVTGKRVDKRYQYN